MSDICQQIAELQSEIEVTQTAITAKSLELSGLELELSGLELELIGIDSDLQTAQTEYTVLAAELEQIVLDIADAQSRLTKANRMRYLELVKLSYEQEKIYLESQPDKISMDVWACYLDDELAGEVAIGEVPNSLESVNIVGTGGSSSTGKWQNYINLKSPAAIAYNFAIKYWWAKHRPSYRYATISALNKTANTATITLEPATVKVNGTTLDLNQQLEFTDVPVGYMRCGVLAFTDDQAPDELTPVSDTVLVQFNGNDITNPWVIGFKENPRTCCAFCKEFEFDLDENPSVITKDESAPIFILGGCPPYEWSVEGAGSWAFAKSTTDVKYNFLTAGCGTGVVTISCVCGDIGGDIASGFMSSVGVWTRTYECGLGGQMDGMGGTTWWPYSMGGAFKHSGGAGQSQEMRWLALSADNETCGKLNPNFHPVLRQACTGCLTNEEGEGLPKFSSMCSLTNGWCFTAVENPDSLNQNWGLRYSVWDPPPEGC